MAFIRKKKSPGIPAIDSPRTERGENSRVFTASDLRALAEANDLSTSPLEVHKLTDILGIKLLCIPMDDDISGSLRISESGDHWVMKVNSLHHPNRQRFTIAHELGHFALHTSSSSDFVDRNFFRNNDTSPMETEANRFASELLMPEQEFREQVKTLAGDIESLSKHFKVSTLAVRVRAKTLGMQGHGL
ncbi:TPA: ImmA/IrrE family metallo-endopeptidase [Pseudomonas aeruginosa]|nr:MULTISPECIES: ImmA/IrrE family metallo-endopeptidase [Pseudomonas aeruginosa group]EOQ79129.1 hypothetical protein K652_18752 [Pseudomonas aeruginosa VRFPA02]EKD1543209.1 ImmA/IrrE family metallo-endopeptidase [Pseudomonas aeruginosa]EKV8095869.1 ImmA/IrrE family metallo-endopeptidase [Pseudomonas aeruginosa]EKW6727557.1 ImmA/IrrE family metallo-endopeptidase [Pseudomonas aeruginosa]EKX2045199.1 ImmA/IrrE family metallo-endopeptidase [Pseudomonas aeruginosa]